jgi:hypothetical protein
MSADDRRPEELVKDEIDEVRLGDALAKDENLLAALPSLHETINADASGLGGWFAAEFLKNAWGDYVSPVWKAARKTIDSAVKRFTDIETRRILARSVATVNKATAKKIEAEAEAIIASEERKNKLLEFLINQKIDMASEQREDLLRIVFVKADRKDNGVDRPK